MNDDNPVMGKFLNDYVSKLTVKQLAQMLGLELGEVVRLVVQAQGGSSPKTKWKKTKAAKTKVAKTKAPKSNVWNPDLDERRRPSYALPSRGSGKLPPVDKIDEWLRLQTRPCQMIDIFRGFKLSRKYQADMRAALKFLQSEGRIKVTGHGTGTRYESTKRLPIANQALEREKLAREEKRRTEQAERAKQTRAAGAAAEEAH